MNTTEAEAKFGNEYVTIGKGTAVWYVERIDLAGLHLSAMFTGKRRSIALADADRLTVKAGQ